MRSKIVHKLALAVSFFAATLFLPIEPGHAGKLRSCGKASWYALNSRTASGEWMNPHAMTAAHKTLPFGTKVRVTNLRNGRSAVVRINDRGPFIRGRVIDVSRRAARSLRFRSRGWTRVHMKVVSRRGRGRRICG